MSKYDGYVCDNPECKRVLAKEDDPYVVRVGWFDEGQEVEALEDFHFCDKGCIKAWAAHLELREYKLLGMPMEDWPDFPRTELTPAQLKTSEDAGDGHE